MEPPFFGNRLCPGNAVPATGLICYNFDRDLSFDLSRGYSGRSSCKKPERVFFWTESLIITAEESRASGETVTAFTPF